MKLYLFFVLLFSFNLSYAQQTDGQRKQALSKLLEAEKIKNAERKKRIDKYTNVQNEKIKQNKNGENATLLYDVSKNGTPIFYRTHSNGTTTTTGAAILNDETQLGLRGKGMRIGVWDAGRATDSHVELAGKVFSGDNAETNSHASRVTGVILARGVNPLARGMAPEATTINYDFNNDIVEMISAASNDTASLILSNHSYGLLAGWFAGLWFGDPEISDQEDWVFGFYDEGARSWDELAYNAPYFLAVTSAGNDRGKSGNGPYPPNGPYDVITGNGVAKNNITVGGIHKIESPYEKPSDARMYNFSSWGPTDDGRIKPDLVGAAVDVLTVGRSGNNSYTTGSGTSFAAPNVTGTLALLQELNRKLNGEYLKSAALKGLAIHTAHEAGIDNGPDYGFGWGVLNAVGASELIIHENSTNNIIKNVILKNGDTYSLDINPKEGTEVKVTVCWTDLPGTPAEPQLDPKDLMLVNDLDMRVSNDSEEHFPWILNPAIPLAKATKGDNFRDNVEKIEFLAGNSGKYTITVGHKGELVMGAQEFSIIVSYESDETNTYYRIGNNPEWNNPDNWSATSGGSPLGRVPGPENTVIFDQNTFSQMSGMDSSNDKLTFSLDTDVEMSRLIVSAGQEVDILLNGHNLVTNRALMLTTEKVQFKGEGNIILRDSEGKNNFPLSCLGNNFGEANIIVDFVNGSTLSLDQNLKFKSLTIEKGDLKIENSEITIGKFLANNQGEISITDSKIRISEQFEIGSTSNYSLNNVEFIFEPQGSARFNLNGSLNDETNASDELTVRVESGELKIESDIDLSGLILEQGTTLTITDGKTVDLSNSFSITANESSFVNIRSTGISTINMGLRRLICFDFINITGVNTRGEAVINVGLNSTITNATGWLNSHCEEVVYADFTNRPICIESAEKIENFSNGRIEKYRWFIDDILSSEEASPILHFPEVKSYLVRLEIEDAEGTFDSITKTIMVEENNLPANEILLVDSNLRSVESSDTYQWFRDGVLLEGETRRIIAHRGISGTYFVVNKNDRCSRRSNEFILSITSVENDLLKSAYNIFPNPASNLLNVTLQSSFTGEVKIELIEISGRMVYQSFPNKNTPFLEEEINTSTFPNGLYIIVISQGKNKESKLVAIKK